MIKALPKDKHAGEVLSFHYYTRSHYAFDISEDANELRFILIKKPLPTLLDKSFEGQLYASHCEAPEAYGYFLDEKRVGVLEIDYLAYAKRVRITELLVNAKSRHQGIGKALMAFAESRAKALKARAIVLETQSCNIDAIRFYEACGYKVIGFDLMAYSNHDVQNGEVRIEMGKSID